MLNVGEQSQNLVVSINHNFQREKIVEAELSQGPSA